MWFDEQFAKNLDMIESALVALAAYVAIRVALGWRKDFLARRRLELGEHLLVKIYEARGVVESLREQFQFTLSQGFDQEVELNSFSVGVLVSEIDDAIGRLDDGINAIKAFEAPSIVLHGDDLEAYFYRIGETRNSVRTLLSRVRLPMRMGLHRADSNTIDPERVPAIRDAAKGNLQKLLGSTGDGRSDGAVYRLLQAIGALEARCSEGLFDSRTRSKKAEQFVEGLDEVVNRLMSKYRTERRARRSRRSNDRHPPGT